MESKKTKKIIITGVATLVGVFGGLKVYKNKKKKNNKVEIEVSE